MSKTRLLPRALLAAGFMFGAQAALATLSSTATATTTATATAWDEAVSGDLANSGSTPSAVSLALGTNLIIGTTGRVSGVVDRDYFTFTLPTGWQLDTLTVLPGTTALGTSGLSFIAVQAGPRVTVSPTGGSAAGLLGWAHYGENDIGTDILQIMGFGGGATGFFGALPAGSYAFWIQDTGTGVANYRLDFGVSAVPEPAAALMLLAGGAALAGVAGLRRRGLRSSAG